VFWALLVYFFSGLPDLLRDAQPGTAKERAGFSTGVIFLPHTCDKINTVLFLWLMIGSWGTGQNVLIPVLVPFGRFARRRPIRPSFKLPGECGGIFRAVIIKKLSERY